MRAHSRAGVGVCVCYACRIHPPPSHCCFLHPAQWCLQADAWPPRCTTAARARARSKPFSAQAQMLRLLCVLTRIDVVPQPNGVLRSLPEGCVLGPPLLTCMCVRVLSAHVMIEISWHAHTHAAGICPQACANQSGKSIRSTHNGTQQTQKISWLVGMQPVTSTR